VSDPVDRLAARAGAPRSPGARALRTRARLLQCVSDLVDEVSYRELTSALVTQRLGLSAGAFYRYFGDINDAIFELTATMRVTADEIADVVRRRSWDDKSAERTALAVIDAMAGFWTTHRSLYRVTDLCADEGDDRFKGVKAATFADVTRAVESVIGDRQRLGDHPPTIDPFATACVVVAMLIHTMAREEAFGLAGVGRAALRGHLARVIVATVTGTPPSE